MSGGLSSLVWLVVCIIRDKSSKKVRFFRNLTSKSQALPYIQRKLYIVNIHHVLEAWSRTCASSMLRGAMGRLSQRIARCASPIKERL